MRILGIDPGKTIGLAVYDTHEQTVTEASQARTVQEVAEYVRQALGANRVDAFAIERPRIYSHAGNELADTIEQFGALWRVCGGTAPLPAETRAVQAGVYRVEVQGWDFSRPLYGVERRAVVRELYRVLGEDVRGDAGVWAALVELHGGRGTADRRATRSEPAGVLGLLHGLPHGRAAFATAWAAGQIEDGQSNG